MSEGKPKLMDMINEAVSQAEASYKMGATMAPKITISVLNFVAVIVIFALIGILLVALDFAIWGFIIIVATGLLVMLLIIKLANKQKRGVNDANNSKP